MACLPFLFATLAALSLLAKANVMRDWCPTKNASLASGNALLALEGKTIKAGAVIYPPFSVLDESTGEWSGFDLEVFREVARRGKFDFEIIKLDSPAENETWDDVLYGQGSEIDITCVWWGETYARKAKGTAFTYPILDQSLILATPVPKRVQRSFVEQFWVFLQPFSRALWLILLFGNLFTAIVVFILDPHIQLDPWTKAKGNRRIAETYYPMSGGMLGWCKYALVSVSNFFFQGWLLGTTQVPFKHPRNPWMKIYLMSWAGVLIVLTAAYTAQLTSFLLIDSRPVDSIDNMDEVTGSGLPVCAEPVKPFVKNFFLNSAPSVPVVAIPTASKAFQAIRNQECAAALAGKADFELLLAENQKCDMRVVGRTLKDVNAGFAGDSSNCGSFVVHVIGGIVQQIAEEGLLENMWSTYITRPPQCAWEQFQFERSEGQKNQLQVEALGGLFIIHAAFAFLALVGNSVQKFLQSKKGIHKDDSLFDDSERGTPEGPSLRKLSESAKSLKNIQLSGKQLTKGMASFGQMMSVTSKNMDPELGDSADPSVRGASKNIAEMTDPSPISRSSSQTPLKLSMAKQPSDALPPKLAVRTALVAPRDRGASSSSSGSPRSGLEASPPVANSAVMDTDDLLRLQDDLSRANSSSKLAAGSSPRQLGSSGGSQELGSSRSRLNTSSTMAGLVPPIEQQQQTLIAPEQGADAVKPFKLEEDNKESHAK